MAAKPALEANLWGSSFRFEALQSYGLRAASFIYQHNGLSWLAECLPFSSKTMNQPAL